MTENISKRKTILLGMPKSFDFSELITTQLELAGFKVIDIGFKDYDFKYSSFVQRLCNLFYKLILNDRNYKGILKFKPYKNEINNRLNSVDVIDYALLIRGDIYPKKILEIIRGKSRKVFNYQWDGIERYPLILERIKFFDKVFAFDPNDVAKFGFLPLTNFYFPINLLEDGRGKNGKAALFLGSCFNDRYSQLETISNGLISNGWNFNCFLFGKEPPTLNFSYTFLKMSMPYKTYLELLSIYDLLIDNSISAHNGLSFRILESIGYEKKIITNNPTVVFYDFYLPSNILVVSNLIDDQQFSNFLETPYVPLPQKIKEKYSFQNWLNNILGIEPFDVIELPKIDSK